MTEPYKIPEREDVEILAREIRDLKEVLRELSGKLGRIEKRLRVFFPAAFPKSKPRANKGQSLQSSPPTMTSEQVLGFYNELIDLVRADRRSQVEDNLARLALGDLALLVRELGAPTGNNPSRSGLTKSVMGRLKQSIMLSRHSSRPASSPSASSAEKLSEAEVSDQPSDDPDSSSQEPPE
jgi:hypothetical protein